MLIEVVAGIIYKDDKFLIAQRNLKKAQGGLWEFPGGKREPGESFEDALKREIKEEFDADIEVKEYLPIEKKMEMITDILNSCADDNYRFYNPGYLEMQTVLNIIFYYTNLTFTAKQKENLPKIYDSVISSGFYNEVISLIPEEEVSFIKEIIKKSIKSIYKYNNCFTAVGGFSI